MKTGFSEAAAEFVSASQVARVETEAWAGKHMFCPNCGHGSLTAFPANQPVADFFCTACGEQYELKSQSRIFGKKVADGAYQTKINRLASNTSPNLVLLHYNRSARAVENLKIVPKQFFAPHTIEKRKPLAATARRAGWIGSNILLERIPNVGQISVIQGGRVRERAEVLKQWSELKFVEAKIGEARGWLLEVLRCVELIQHQEFSLGDVYSFEKSLSATFPHNNNVRPKIRQQLQVLRDAGYLEFQGRGKYRRLTNLEE